MAYRRAISRGVAANGGTAKGVTATGGTATRGRGSSRGGARLIARGAILAGFAGVAAALVLAPVAAAWVMAASLPVDALMRAGKPFGGSTVLPAVPALAAAARPARDLARARLVALASETALMPAVLTTGVVSLPPPRSATAVDVVALPPLESAVRPTTVALRTEPQEASAFPNDSRRQLAALSPAADPRRNDIVGSLPALGNPEALRARDNRTAVYDIAAHTVYLPNGERLEAHSGLGASFDDPRSARIRMHGVTPPNVYNLAPREQIFHGVAALRLNPLRESDMFGRAGILAHSYMLGPRGESNGCVSFRDYARFLQAYRRGEVTRLLVVTRLAGSPANAVASLGDRYADSSRDTRNR